MHTCNINELHKSPPTTLEPFLNNPKILLLPLTIPLHPLPKTLLLPPKHINPIPPLTNPTL